ncbi:MAG TPA: nitronate monooxygenase family protein [Steroidobacteraceae bacterium]|mgnify:FL=1
MHANSPESPSNAVASLSANLRIPVIAAPMFLVSGLDLVIAQCRAGIVGSFPSLNARPASQLDEWLHRISEATAGAAPYAVNLIVHESNPRLEQDLETCVRHKVPIIITSLGARSDVNDAIHAYGGVVFHDVIHDAYARKAVERGVDGLVAVAAGAGGHAGTQSPFALLQEIRRWYSGPLALSGAIATGRSLLAARILGADFGYIGSAFIATHEAAASDAYKQMITESGAMDILYSNRFTGIWGNYLIPSLRRAGLDPTDLSDVERLGLGKPNAEAKAWRDIWGAGQGIGAITEVTSVAALVAHIEREYNEALNRVTSGALNPNPARRW